MYIPKRLIEIAKKLYQHQTGFKGIVTNNHLRKTYPGFKSSNKSHWEYLILKLLGRNKKANKHPKFEEKTMQETRKPQEVKLDELQSYRKYLKQNGLTFYGNSEYSGVSLTVKVVCENRNKLFKGVVGYNFLRNIWFYRVGQQVPIYCSSAEAANKSLVHRYIA